MNGPVTQLWGGLVAELVATRPGADAELIERACEVADEMAVMADL